MKCGYELSIYSCINLLADTHSCLHLVHLISLNHNDLSWLSGCKRYCDDINNLTSEEKANIEILTYFQ